jgi:hypothetical protein
MRRLASTLPVLFFLCAPMHGQTCTKTVSFALADASGVHPFMGTNNWIGKWVKKNAKKHPRICFSQSPTHGLANYLIVLSQSASYLTGFDPVAKTDVSTSTTPVSGTGTVADSDGETWNYRYYGTATTTTTTTSQENVPYTLRSNTVFAYAYGSDGALVSTRFRIYSSRSGGDASSTAGYNLGSALAAINARGRLLSSVVADVEKNEPPSEPAHQPVVPPSIAPQAPVSAQRGVSRSSDCKPYANTGEKEFITDSSDGKVLTLSDGSIWEVMEVDTVDSQLWLVADDVIVIRADSPIGCFVYTIINTSGDVEKVQARYLGQR